MPKHNHNDKNRPYVGKQVVVPFLMGHLGLGKMEKDEESPSLGVQVAPVKEQKQRD